MGYFLVRYDSGVVNYDRRGFIRLAPGVSHSLNIFCLVLVVSVKYTVLNKSSFLNGPSPACFVVYCEFSNTDWDAWLAVGSKRSTVGLGSNPEHSRLLL